MLKELGIPVIPGPDVIEENIIPDSPLDSGVRAVYKRVIPLPIREVIWTWRHKEQSFPYMTHVSAGGITAEFAITSRRAKILLQEFGWEKGFLTEFLRSMRDDDVVWDIGANRGLYTVFAAKKVKNGSVISFEPDTQVCPELELNVSLNTLNGNVRLRRHALGNINGSTQLYTDTSGLQKSASLKPVKMYKDHLPVPVATADSLVESGEIPAPTIVKLDVEGAEGEVLAGMKGLLSSDAKPRHLFVELHNTGMLHAFGTDARTVYGLLVDAGYTIVSARERATELLCHFTSP